MMTQTPGRIFLADYRGFTETKEFSRHFTIRFGEPALPEENPLTNLEVLNDEMLAGSCKLVQQTWQDSYLILLPVTGDLILSDPQGRKSLVEVEQVHISFIPAHSGFELINPYLNDTINFLQIRVRASHPAAAAIGQVYAFDLARHPNTLVPVAAAAKGPAPGLPFSLSIGRFSGRAKASYRMQQHALLFAFVISGAFEIEGRLLHARDGLALWEVEEMEVEALSEDATVLVLGM